MNIYLDHVNESLKKATEMAHRLENSSISDVASQIIQTIELLIDEIDRASKLENDISNSDD